MIIPREGDLVRFYTQLSATDVVDPLTGRVDKNKMTPQELVSVRLLTDTVGLVFRLMTVDRSPGRSSIHLSWLNRKKLNGGQFISVRPCRISSDTHANVRATC